MRSCALAHGGRESSHAADRTGSGVRLAVAPAYQRALRRAIVARLVALQIAGVCALLMLHRVLHVPVEPAGVSAGVAAPVGMVLLWFVPWRRSWYYELTSLRLRIVAPFTARLLADWRQDRPTEVRCGHWRRCPAIHVTTGRRRAIDIVVDPGTDAAARREALALLDRLV